MPGYLIAGLNYITHCLWTWHKNPLTLVKDTTKIVEARQAAVTAAYEKGGHLAILSMAEAAEAPSQLGASFAFSMNPGLVLDLTWKHLGSPVLKLRDFAHGALAKCFRQFGWQFLEEAIGRVSAGSSTPQALAEVYLAAPALRETWQRLDNESQEVQTSYWKSLGRFEVMAWDSEDMALLSISSSRFNGLLMSSGGWRLGRYLMNS